MTLCRGTFKFNAGKYKVNFVINFRTMTGATLFLCYSSHSEGPYAIKQGEGSVFCKIESLDLAEGLYTLNLGAFRGRTTYDEIASTSLLEVETLDFFGNGSIYPKGHSPFMVRSHWHLEKKIQ